MNTLDNQSYTPEICPRCPNPYGLAPKPVHPHKYGDYVVLTPDKASAHKLHHLAKKASDLVASELGSDAVQIQDADEMHLTLAMPLKPLSREETGELLSMIKRNSPKTPVLFDLIFRGKDQGGSHGFSFGTMTYAPGFNVQLREPNQAWNGHNSAPSHRKMRALADRIHSHCENKDLVSLKKNPNGQCNRFNPHISLGSVKGPGDSKALHDRVAHYDKDSQTALSHLMSQIASGTFQCENAKHKHCSKLPLRFDKVEVLRVDALEGDSHATYRLGSLDLQTGKTQLSPSFPACSHGPGSTSEDDALESQSLATDFTSSASIAAKPADDPSPEISLTPALDRIDQKIISIGPRSFSFAFGKDHKGAPMIQVRFSDEFDAQYILDTFAPTQKNRKLHYIDGDYVVNLGPNRLKNMFGAGPGNKIYQQGISELGGKALKGTLPAARKNNAKKATTKKEKKAAKKAVKKQKKAAKKAAKSKRKG